MGDEEIKDKYQEIKDKLTYKEFLEEIQEIKDENETAFLTEAQAVEMVLTKYQDITNKPLTTPNQITQIVDLIDGNGNINIQGRLLKISNTKVFTTKKGREGKVANLTVADKTGQIRVVLWTDNIKYINRIQEGDIIKIKNLEVKTGYTGDLEVQMRNNSSIQVMPEEVDEALPEFSEKITNLQDITEEGEYTVIVRITKISGIQTIPREDKELTLVNLDIMDKTGHTQLTLWNNDTKLVEELDLKVNDSIKIIGARCRLRNNEPSLSNSWNGRIIKGDYDVPEYKEEITKLGNAQEQDNAIILGIITKIYDTITFERDNGTEGKVRSIEVTDDTGEIRVTLWNENTEIQMEKGNIIKISGGTIEDDTYSNEAYRLNTGWDALIQINPSIDPELKEKLEKITSYQSVPIENVLDVDIEEGREVDVIGRILSIDDIREFQRVDGTEGKVRSIDLSDNTGTVKTSLWDEKTELKEKLGDAIKIENARTRLGQGNMELSVGKTSRITNPNNEELEKIGTYEELENLRYKDRTIDQLVENEKDSKIKARILKVNDVNKFIRNDDSTGQVRSIEIADNTGIVQITLWDKDTEKIFHENEAVIIENPSISLQNDQIRLSISRGSTIKKMSDEEANDLPTIPEIEAQLYKERYIEDIEEDDENIKITATIESTSTDQIVFPMCPNCNKRVTSDENGFNCEVCGEKIEEPNYLMIISTILEDDTGTITTTFFRTEAEKLIDKTTSEAVEILNATGDETALSGILEDCIGAEITIIADANYNQYEENMRLNVKKLIR